MTDLNGALQGIRVLDMSRALAGPFAAMTLGDFGADVIKVEEPRHGDPTRGFPPFWNGESTYYLSANRNKRSLTLDLEQEEGRVVARELAARSDVVIESFRTGAMEKWGLGWEVLREANPRLVYCAISAVGREGPDKERAGVDLLMQAYGGLMGITGEAGGEPVRTGTSVVDLATGANAVQGILAALFVRERTGKGQRVDVSLLGSLVGWLGYHAVAFFATGEQPARMGSRHPSVAPYGAFPTRDGHLVVAVAMEASWRRFCAALGQPGLTDDLRFAKNPDRIANRAELERIVTAALADRTAAEWGAIMDGAGVPCSPINDLATVLSLPQVLHQEFVIDLPHADIPDLRMPGVAIKLADTPGIVRLAPPRLGEHTAEILAELGRDAAAIARLRESGIV